MSPRDERFPRTAHVVVALIVSFMLWGVMVFGTLPYLRRTAGGLEPFDLRPFGYTPEEARALLYALSDIGRAYYADVQLQLDTAARHRLVRLFRERRHSCNARRRPAGRRRPHRADKPLDTRQVTRRPGDRIGLREPRRHRIYALAASPASPAPLGHRSRGSGLSLNRCIRPASGSRLPLPCAAAPEAAARRRSGPRTAPSTAPYAHPEIPRRRGAAADYAY